MPHGHRRHGGQEDHESPAPASRSWEHRSLGSADGPRRDAAARLRYRFDRSLSRSPWVLVGWLGLITLAIVLAGAMVIAVFHLGIEDGESVGFLESFWQALLRVMEPTSLAEDKGWSLRMVSLVVTLSGIFVASALIGLIAASLEQRISGLRRGRSAVLERGHILILGWSERLFSVVSELVEANANQRRAAIVVLADRDKTRMEDALRNRVGGTGSTEIICRTGDPASGADLDLVSDRDARAIVVLADDGSEGDAAAIPAALMVLHRDPARTGIVVETSDPRTARDLVAATAGRVHTVESDDIIAKVTAQACYQAGVGAVFQELLNFAGDELYFTGSGPVVGRTFAEAVLAYEAATVIGRIRDGGTIELAPAAAAVVEASDRLIVLAADDDAIHFTGFRDRAGTSPGAAPPIATAPSHLLIVGWSRLGSLVLRHLAEFPDRPGAVDVLLDESLVEAAECVDVAGIAPGLRWLAADDERGRLGELLAEARYDHVLVLAYRSKLSPAEADAHTLLTLATIHRLTAAAARPPQVVAEVVDPRNTDIARATGADDLVVSNRMASLLIAQLSEQPTVSEVFRELFDPDGASLELRPAGGYATGSIPFSAVTEAASARDEVAVGYRLRSGVVRINPPKSEPVTLSADDRVVVLTRPRPAGGVG